MHIDRERSSWSFSPLISSGMGAGGAACEPWFVYAYWCSCEMCSKILQNGELFEHTGWAFGLGLERLAMILFQVSRHVKRHTLIPKICQHEHVYYRNTHSYEHLPTRTLEQMPHQTPIIRCFITVFVTLSKRASCLSFREHDSP